MFNAICRIVFQKIEELWEEGICPPSYPYFYILNYKT